MSICPNCGNELKMADRVTYNAENYSKSVVGKAECCGKLVRATPITSFRFETLTDYEIENRKQMDSDGKLFDDWGEPVED